ncbi:Imidazolonepropionase [Pseudoxanthomonas sp. GM95]|uniref:amidohydrolase family protein n=1 Tax=Pseudoxanthomonas sp. GM95 TaxID=1881043 RepID=UPI0008C266E0|nr:amidohydrolase family protein [Pseudoxanthomonas sp. GM95]SEL18622.1 Imidazolonepropionase [Pseudoxanthomonas sp. GM95]
MFILMRFLAAASLTLAASIAIAGDALPRLAHSRSVSFTATEATWSAVDVSPDGKTLLFDLLGDIYRLDRAGGRARPLLDGVAFENMPVFSPDGRQFAFVSDRSGSDNVWVANVDGSGLRQLSQDSGVEYFASPAWSPDGKTVYASRSVPSLLAFELYAYPVDGGPVKQITKAKPSGTEDFDQRKQALGVAASPDGRFLYYATKTGTTWTTRAVPPLWSIVRRDLRTGAEDTLIASPGGAMRPVLSHDGNQLVYATRQGTQTGLRIRDLRSGEDRWLALPVDRDGQEGGFYADLLPRFAFTPDDQAIVFSRNGHLVQRALHGQENPIPFTAQVKLEIGPELHVDQRSPEGPVKVRLIGKPSLSPDGRRWAFSALGRLYVMDVAEGAQARLLDAAGTQAWQPSWSPDSRTLTYVTWGAKEGGAVWTVGADGQRSPVQINQGAGYYTDPVFDTDGRGIFALRSSHHDRLRLRVETGAVRAADIVRMPATGGVPQLIAQAYGARGLALAGSTLRYDTGAGVMALASDGAAPARQVAAVKVLAPSQYVAASIVGGSVRLSPDGRHALTVTGGQLMLVPLPAAGPDGKPPLVDLAATPEAAVQLTAIGADTFDWNADGTQIVWTRGARLLHIGLDQALALRGRGQAEGAADMQQAGITLPRATPDGLLVLRGATALTMQNGQVIENADVLVGGGRILRIGTRDSFAIPAQAAVRDLQGKFLVPGFVDEHAHWFQTRRGILEPDPWDFLVDLAYGVTTGMDPQSFTPEVFAYQDMIEAGLAVGPRVFSTGPGFFRDTRIESVGQAELAMQRYRDDYATRNLKSYMPGNRAVRRQIVDAARRTGMMPTTEGASDLRLDLTHVLDGFAGNEHALPVAPLHDDVVQLFARTGTSYAPTFSMLYGARPILDEMIQRYQPQQDAKLQRFIPAAVLDEKTRSRKWSPPDQREWPRFAAQALKIQRAGGVVGIGSHGEMPGLGYHWELEAYVAGGATPMEALYAATMGSARTIGHAGEIGSLSTGKFADLLVLERDPRQDIRNTNSLVQVMKNGRLYDAQTLDQQWPTAAPLPVQWFNDPSLDPLPPPSPEGTP